MVYGVLRVADVHKQNGEVMNPIDYQSVLLDSVTYANEQILNHRLPNVEVTVRDIGIGLLVGIQTHIAATEVKEVRYPSTWVEALKERWAPAWFLKRFPVLYVVLNLRVLFPDHAIVYGRRLMVADRPRPWVAHEILRGGVS